MRVEVVGNELRELRASLARDGVNTVGFEAQPSGLAIKINGGLWEPLGMVTKTDEPSRFPYVGGAKVLAHWFDKTEDRFVILADKGHGQDPFVVAYAKNLSDSEWYEGRRLSDYGDAATLWFNKVNAAVNAGNVAPSVKGDPGKGEKRA